MKRCGGEYTLDDALTEAKTLEEMADAAADFPGTVTTSGWTEKQAALADIKAKAKAAADAWCQKRDCRVGDCHQLGMPEIEILDETTHEVKDGPLKGLKFYSVIAKVKKVKCGCQKPKEEKPKKH